MEPCARAWESMIDKIVANRSKCWRESISKKCVLLDAPVGWTIWAPVLSVRSRIESDLLFVVCVRWVWIRL